MDENYFIYEIKKEEEVKKLLEYDPETVYISKECVKNVFELIYTHYLTKKLLKKLKKHKFHVLFYKILKGKRQYSSVFEKCNKPPFFVIIRRKINHGKMIEWETKKEEKEEIMFNLIKNVMKIL